MLDKLETELTESYREGRLSAAAKEALEKASVMLGTASQAPEPAEANTAKTGADGASGTNGTSEASGEPPPAKDQPPEDSPRSA